jgi:hypothetical protein
MFLTRLLSLFLLVSIAASCKKDTADNAIGGFIKTMESDSDMVVGNSVPDGGNSVIVVCRTLEENSPGLMYRIDFSGNLLWAKPLSALNTHLWLAYDLPGNGFATLGYQNATTLAMEVCLYNDDGNLQSSKQIPIGLNDPWASMGGFSPFHMLRLSNGNYAFAGNYMNDLFLCITNGNFDTLSQRKYTMPYGSFLRGLCESPDGFLTMSTSAAVLSPDYLHFDYDTRIIRTDLSGVMISNSVLEHDTLHNEAPSAMVRLAGGFLLITGRMGMNNDGSGTYVNYLNNYYGSLCSGEINLVKLDKDGKFVSRQSIRDYPANGVILNVRPTVDGGFILCGTVGQATVQNIVSGTRMYIMKVNSSGRFEWSKTFPARYPALGVDAIEMPGGGYVVSGYEKAFDRKFNAMVIRTNGNGDI